MVPTPGLQSVEIERSTVLLPNDDVTGLFYEDVKAPLEIIRRSYKAEVFSPRGLPDDDRWLRDQKVIVFGKGWANTPGMYKRLLNPLVAQGYVIIAPLVKTPDFALPWSPIETFGKNFFGYKGSLRGKLQTAMLIDIVRAAQMASRGGAREVHYLGHSMGGAMALAALRFETSVVPTSVVLLAPAVQTSVETPLNQHVHTLKDDEEKMREMAGLMADSPLLFLHGSADNTVESYESTRSFEALKERKSSLLGCGIIEGGAHIGFQNPSDNIDEDTNRELKCFSAKEEMNAMGDASSGIWDIFKEQRLLTLSILELWYPNVGKLPDSELVSRIESVPNSEKTSFQWDSVKSADAE